MTHELCHASGRAAWCQPSAEGKAAVAPLPRRAQPGGTGRRSSRLGELAQSHTQAGRAPFSKHRPQSLVLHWDSTVSLSRAPSAELGGEAKARLSGLSPPVPQEGLRQTPFAGEGT